MSTQIAIAVVEHEGRFLVGERPVGVRLAGFAEFPGGKVDEGESPSAAAVRECWEEAGVNIRVMNLLETVDDANAGLQLHFFHCCPISDEIQACPPFRWIALDELANHRFPPANATVVARLLSKTNEATGHS